MYFSFLSFTFTSFIPVLWPFDIHCTYLWIYIYIYIYVDVCYSPIFTCVVSFLSLCTCFLYIVCNLLFLFHTKMSWWVLFKVFQKYRLFHTKMSWWVLSTQLLVDFPQLLPLHFHTIERLIAQTLTTSFQSVKRGFGAAGKYWKKPRMADATWSLLWDLES